MKLILGANYLQKNSSPFTFSLMKSDVQYQDLDEHSTHK